MSAATLPPIDTLFTPLYRWRAPSGGSASMGLRIHVLSDLHIEFGDWRPPPTDADVVVLAGDIMPGVRGLAWARERFPRARIVYVLGNHEFYGGQLQATLDRARTLAVRLEIDLLEGGEVVIDGVRFLGTTLWTDFEIAGSDPESMSFSMWLARRNVSDYSQIRCGEESFHPAHAREIHLQRRRWLQRKLRRPHRGPTVVVTHHLPHRRSVHRKFAGHPLNPVFASHLPDLVRAPVDVWIHGHTHHSCDYRVDGTRVVCNPRGYAPHDLNPDFEADLIVEV